MISKKNLYIILAVALAASISGCAASTRPAAPAPGKADYTAADNWLNLPSVADAPVDVFYLYPTVISGDEHYCSLNDSEMRTEAQKLYQAYSGIFSGCNFYAPYYHQLSISYISGLNTTEKLENGIAEVPLKDCEAAFTYYLTAHSDNKPIIFASHSQGTIIMKQLLLWIKEAHPEVLQRMVAAYMIGFAINPDYLNQVGLPFAQGADDTGAIICYNTESPGAAASPFTMSLYKDCLAINPINWKTDDTYASKDESLGSRIRPEDATANLSAGDHPHFADAQIDLARGTVVTHAPVESGGFWPKGILHHYDYDLFYYDLQRNVKTRIQAYLSHNE